MDLEQMAIEQAGYTVEFKEFEPRLRIKPGLKYGWFRLKLYSIFNI